LAFGAWTGVRITSIPRTEEFVEGVAEVRVAVVDEEPERPLIVEPHDQVARLLCDLTQGFRRFPGRSGCIGAGRGSSYEADR
jgi:hypothetical protein